MKFFVFLSVIIACTSAAPGYGTHPSIIAHTSFSSVTPIIKDVTHTHKRSKDDRQVIPLVKTAAINDSTEKNTVDSKTGNDSKILETANMKDIGVTEGPVTVPKGSYSFQGKDGKSYTVSWSADESGLNAQGKHLPTSTPIPEEIKKSLLGNEKTESLKEPVATPVPTIVKVCNFCVFPSGNTTTLRIESISSPAAMASSASTSTLTPTPTPESPESKAMASFSSTSIIPDIRFKSFYKL